MEYSLLVLILKNLVILPYQEIKIELKDTISKNIIKLGNKDYNGKVLIVAPIDSKETNPSIDDLPNVGVIADIRSAINLPNNNLRVSLKGEKRVSIKEYASFSEDILISNVKDIILPKYDKLLETATIRKIKEILNDYIESSSLTSNSILKTISNVDSINFLSDIITTFLPLPTNKKLEYMQEINGINRANKLINDLLIEIKLCELDKEIDDKIQIKFNKKQEEFYLKEKINELKHKLGSSSLNEEEINKFREILKNNDFPVDIRNKLNREIDKYELTSEISPEGSVIRNYLDWVLSLPFNKSTKEVSDPKKVLNSLNKSHYGLNKIKERITDYVYLKGINPKIKSPIICLVGPPGVGKTTIVSSIAKSLNREFYKISVAGLNDSIELIGNRRSYLGALPGKIIQGLRKVDANNPVMLIDEVDKMVKDYKGDPASTLLDILDSTQNKSFVDNYIEEPFDLSHVLFILTANTVDTIPSTLLDRVEVIQLNSYTEYEKLDIAKKYLIPNIYKEFNISKKIKIKDNYLSIIINNYTKESGVRELSRVLEKIVRKALITNIYEINNDFIKENLGYELYQKEMITEKLCGVVNALAYTPYGGEVLKVEVVSSVGCGKLKKTGYVGRVLEESIDVVISYIVSNYIDKKVIDNLDLHIHLLEGGTKKDGPSCGVALTTAILSLLKSNIIPDDISFTGEISLAGNILKVGGVKEKIIAGYNYGIRKIYVPYGNKYDVLEIPDVIKKEIDIVLVNNYEEIYQDLFK